MTVTEALRVSPFFTGLSPWDLETLRSAMAVRRYARGEALIAEGRSGEGLFLVLEGRAEVTERDDRSGTPRRLQTVEPGEIVGFLSLIDARPQEVTCTAVDAVTAALLSRTAFGVLQSAGPQIAYQLQSCIFRHLHHELLVSRRALARGVFGLPASERALLPHVVA